MTLSSSMWRAVVVASALASAVQAQSSIDPAPRLAVVAGAGGALAIAQPGIGRDIGPAGIVGVEVGRLWSSGLAERLVLRLEGGLMSQNIMAATGPMSGDVQTAHVAALASMPFFQQDGRTMYAVAGPMWARPSDKVVLDAGSTETPGSMFEQTTHQTAGGVLLGVGVAGRMRSVGVRAEARWMSVATNGKATHLLPLLVSVVVPVRH